MKRPPHAPTHCACGGRLVFFHGAAGWGVYCERCTPTVQVPVKEDEVKPFKRLSRRAGERGGAPCLTGTGIPVEAIAERFAAGDSVCEVALDYEVNAAHVEEALRLVLLCRGTNLREQRAAAKVDRLIPLRRRRG